MKKLIVLLSLVLLSSCSEYQKVYNGKDAEAKYSMAWKMYEKGKYSKADQLFSQIDRMYKRKAQYQRLLFAHAMSLYHMKYYVSAGEKFRKFTQLFPQSSKAEEADLYIVKAYAALSPKYSVDQSYTNRGIEEVESFLKKYPLSKYADEVNAIYAKLNDKLEKKDFTVAKLYYDLMRYKSAITAFNNYMIDFPGSKYKEGALYYRFKAAADLATNSVEKKKKERLEKAISYYNSFKAKNTNKDYAKDAEKTFKFISKEMEIINNKSTNITSVKQ